MRGKSSSRFVKFLNARMRSSKLAQVRAGSHFDRMNSRIADSVQFRIQEEINIRDDEIGRLRSDLAYFRGMASTVTDTAKSKQRSVADQYSELRQILFNANSQLEMEKSQLATQHAKRLQKMDEKHIRDVELLRTQIEAASLPLLQPKESPRRRDRVEEFVEAANRLTGRQSLTKEKQSSSSSESVSESIESVRSPKQSARAQELAKLSQVQSEYQRKARNLRDKIASVERQIEEHSCAMTSHESVASESEDDSDENLRERLSEERRAHDASMDELHARYRDERERGRVLESEISKARAKLVAREKKRKPVQKKSAAEIARHRKYKEMREYLDSMTASEKEVKLAELRAENRALKKEIARLDFKVYGKGGKYRQWKNI